MIQLRYLTSLTSEIESLLSGLVGSDFTSTWHGEDKRKGWGGGHYYFEGGNYFIYSCLRRGEGEGLFKGGDKSRDSYYSRKYGKQFFQKPQIQTVGL